MHRRILITAGPTRESIDAVRYLSNRSSGRLGLSLADAALHRGHEVHLLLGPGPPTPPEHPRLVCTRFESTANLQGLLTNSFPQCDLLIMAAAVADFIPRAADPHAKRPRTDGPMTITLDPTTDLVAQIAAGRRRDQVVIGFAVEPGEHLVDRAQEKLLSKNLDAIVANPLETMDSETISAIFLRRDARPETLPRDMPKPALATWLIEAAEVLLTSAKG